MLENGVLEVCVVETEDVTGDHGREEAIELRDALRLYSGGTGGMSSDRRYVLDDMDGRRGDDFTVPERSSPSTLVELFHAGLFFSVAFNSILSSRFADGDESGVKLCVCLWEGVTGVVGCVLPPMKCSIEARCRRARPGSEDGTRLGLDGLSGVIALGGDFDEPTPVNFFANLRKGEIDRDNVLLLCVRPFVGLSTGGVLRKPLLCRDLDVAPDVLDPASLEAALRSSPVSRRRTCSISASVRAIRSLRFRQR